MTIEPSVPPSSQKKKLKGALGFVVGIALFLWVFLSQDGLEILLGVVRTIGDRWPLLLLPYLVGAALSVLCYRVALPGRGRAVPFGALVHAERSSIIVNSVLPFANYGGNFVKVMLLGHWYTTSEVLAAGVWGAIGSGLCNSLAVVGPVVAIVVGVSDPVAAGIIALLTLTTSVPAFLVITSVRKGLTAKLIRLLGRIPRIPESRKELWLKRAKDFDVHLAKAVGERRRDFALHVFIKSGVQVTRIAEIWLIIELLGLSGGLLVALLFNAVSRTTEQFLSFIPGQFGVFEASAMLGFSALGFSTEDGLAVALTLRFHFFVGMFVSGTALATASRITKKYPASSSLPESSASS
ncbi:MAG: lysylphosphatidylglycerol synthase domain-containing protein [Polyangiales bacterium]